MGIIVPKDVNLKYAFDHIPRIDLSRYSFVASETSPLHNQRAIERAVLESLFAYGIAVVTTSESDAKMADRARKSTADFFAMDVAQKILASNAQNEDGYREWGHSRSYPGFPELNESVLLPTGTYLPGREHNEVIEGLNEALVSFQEFSKGVMDVVLSGLMAHYKSEQYIDFGSHLAMQANSYAKPTQGQIDKAAADMKDLVAKEKLEKMTVADVVAAEKMQGLHDDEVVITIMLPASHPGLVLEVEGSEGKLFVPARLKKGEVAIVPGDLLYLLTGGDIPGLRHTVVNGLPIARRSIQCFVNCSPGTKPFKYVKRVNEGIEDIYTWGAKRAQEQFGSNPGLFDVN